jgi:glycosyltransferase involved in cell wall biosynthesis
MRFLFLTNFYPPLSRGGYEQWCHEVASGLVDRGHDVMVLTSRYQRELAGSDPEWVFRDLHLEMELNSLQNGVIFFRGRKNRERENLAQLRCHIAAFAPDVILIWGMWNLPWSLPAMAEMLMPGDVVYYIGDYWPSLPSQYEFYWQAPPRSWFAYVPKLMLRVPARWMLSQADRPKLRFDNAIFCTEFLRDELRRKNITFGRADIIYGAIDTSRYLEVHAPCNGKFEGGPFTMLFVGRLQYDKGVHTAIEALAYLVHDLSVPDVTLQIVGSGERGYTAYLHDLVQDNNLASHVTFLGAHSQSEMPRIYHQSDILVFTSIWQEPFGRVLVEAMAAGVAVVGTLTGGATEILIENENALTFAPDNATALAKQVARLKESDELRQRLAENGRRTAVEKFDLNRMVDEIEVYLAESV